MHRKKRPHARPDIERIIAGFHDYLDRRDDHSGYARHIGAKTPRPRKHRLSRNTRDAKIAGVCAGVADYFGWRLGTVRAIAIVATVFLFPVPMIIYAILAVVLPAGEPIATLYDTPGEAQFWRDFTIQPSAAYGELKHRFRALDARIATIETAVTSQEFALRREFSNLKGES
jgi:phage shock protein C